MNGINSVHIPNYVKIVCMISTTRDDRRQLKHSDVQRWGRERVWKHCCCARK